MKISPEMHGPAYVGHGNEKTSWPLGRLYDVWVDYGSDGAIHGIEMLDDDPGITAFVKEWCEEHQLEFPELGKSF